MEQAATPSSSLSAEDFAGILAELAKSGSTQEPAWNDDGLADDVATLSYESALRAHARSKSADDEPTDKAGTPEPETVFAETAKRTEQSLPEESRKCVSVTVRMSRAERAQLHKRAAEAGMTISAYLRSCTFEVEALRTQVKEALAELRRANTANNGEEMRTASPKERGTRAGWLRRLIAGGQMHQRAAEA